MDQDAVRDLETRALNGWPALQTVLVHGGWIARFAGGFTKRSNSACAFAPGAVPAARVIDGIEALYRRRGLPPMFRTLPLGHADDEATFTARGYEGFEESLMMRAALGADLMVDPAIVLAPAPSEAWVTGFANSNRYGAHFRPVLEAMLAAIVPQAMFATLIEDGRPVAYGLGVIERGHVGLFDILVEADARGRGLGRRLVGSLMAWGAREGASHAFLQVLGTNAPARALYDGLGFREQYRYLYFRKPA